MDIVRPPSVGEGASLARLTPLLWRAVPDDTKGPEAKGRRGPACGGVGLLKQGRSPEVMKAGRARETGPSAGREDHGHPSRCRCRRIKATEAVRLSEYPLGRPPGRVTARPWWLGRRTRLPQAARLPVASGRLLLAPLSDGIVLFRG